MATKMVTVKAKVGVFLSGGVGLAAGETARISEAAARGYPPSELEIVGPSAVKPPAEPPVEPPAEPPAEPHAGGAHDDEPKTLPASAGETPGKQAGPHAPRQAGPDAGRPPSANLSG